MISSSLAALITTWLAEARAEGPAAVSRDGQGLLIYGDLGGAAYLYKDGHVELEPWDETAENAWREDPGFRTAVLVSASRRRPELAELLPRRPHGATPCGACSGTGWTTIGEGSLVCAHCHGLGWQTVA